ncbi:2Fe-2S ferredoxin-like protein [Methylobacillus caricis]|uniref:class I ribonucleotide reductase maintenance protein YfaE n=1 Tax=Methylobacillus caricis TaxID=1971611 RepID=UPI001CFFF8FC|nr:class I ribonucleotide reductase maintenance protein YfaE [Methylobacillus caricis]MCB5187747.1 2Fe-2S ferredoxin-like protein [Methylobacillus caricis]
MSVVSTRESSFRLVQYETLLDGLERTGHDVEYQCKSGYCGMCRVKILHGDVKYLEQPLAFVAFDEILPCCCIPVADVMLDCVLRDEFRVELDQQELFPMQQNLFTEQELAHDSQNKSPAQTKRRITRDKAKRTASEFSLDLF